MPTSVEQIFKANGKEIMGQVTWGEPINCNLPGVYVIAITDNATQIVGLDEAPISNTKVNEWVSYVPTIRLDNERFLNGRKVYYDDVDIESLARCSSFSCSLPYMWKSTSERLIERLKSFWLPDETILYIGMTGSSLRRRVQDYYKTKLGDPKPHSGGHWIKTLENLGQLNIYWTATEKPEAKIMEQAFLRTFVENVSKKSLAHLSDPNHPYPFANIELTKGTKKNHGIRLSTNH